MSCLQLNTTSLNSSEDGERFDPKSRDKELPFLLHADCKSALGSVMQAWCRSGADPEKGMEITEIIYR
jgi:hypothetical protein